MKALAKRFGSYDGNVIVKRSIELGEPVVYVSMNYRYVLISTTFDAYTDTLLQSFRQVHIQ